MKDLPTVLNSLLTTEEKAALAEQAMSETSDPEEAADGYTDEPAPKPVNVEIGVSTGETEHLQRRQYQHHSYRREGCREMSKIPSDLTAKDIRSERGNVNITVENGSIMTTGDEEQNILGGNVSLKASEDIGNSADDALDLQQRDTTPVVTARAKDEETADDGTFAEGVTGWIHLDENGNWVYDTVITYDWVRKDLRRRDNAAGCRSGNRKHQPQ